MNRNVLLFSVAATLCVAGFTFADDMPGMKMPPKSPASQPAPGMTGMDMPPKTPATQPAADAAAVDLGNTVCPVSGDKVGDSKLTSTYEGKIYHFCCDDCPKKFAKDPATYAKAVEADPAKYGVKSK